MEALKGVRILDMTHVQAGPTCSQLLAWMGADVIKFENPQGDATRGQLRDVPNADSLYFTMLNCNKRSITVNMKTAEGKQVFVDLLKKCDIIMENFGPGVLDRLRFFLGKDPRDQPADRDGLDQGLRLERAVRRLQGLRERGAGDGRRDEHHRRTRRPAVRDRRADRRLGHRAASGGRPACGAASARPHRPGPVRRSGDDGRRDEPVPGQVPRSPAPDSRATFRSIPCRPTRAWARCRAQATTPAAASWATPFTASRTARTTGSTLSSRKRCGTRSRSASDRTSACPTSPPTRTSPPSASGARTSSSCGRSSTSLPRSTPSASSWRSSTRSMCPAARS